MGRTAEILMSDDELIEYLNDAYGTVKVGEYEFDAGDVIANCAPGDMDVLRQDLEQFKCVECGTVYDTEHEATNCCPDNIEDI